MYRIVMLFYILILITNALPKGQYFLNFGNRKFVNGIEIKKNFDNLQGDMRVEFLDTYLLHFLTNSVRSNITIVSRVKGVELLKLLLMGCEK